MFGRKDANKKKLLIKEEDMLEMSGHQLSASGKREWRVCQRTSLKEWKFLMRCSYAIDGRPNPQTR